MRCMFMAGMAILIAIAPPATYAQDAAASTSHDGSSAANAIPIQAQNESDGVRSEYQWIARRYPGYIRDRQSLQHKAGRYYDVLDITTAAGEHKTIYFDITAFFGRL